MGHRAALGRCSGTVSKLGRKVGKPIGRRRSPPLEDACRCVCLDGIVAKRSRRGAW